MTGLEICELLRKDPKLAGIPVLIVSALDDPGSKEKALQAGAREYITKPFGVDNLMQRIKALTGS